MPRVEADRLTRNRADWESQGIRGNLTDRFAEQNPHGYNGSVYILLTSNSLQRKTIPFAPVEEHSGLPRYEPSVEGLEPKNLGRRGIADFLVWRMAKQASSLRRESRVHVG